MLKYWIKTVAVLSSVMYLCSCASIVSKSSKSLPIISQPDDATCEIIDIKSGLTIHKSKTPSTVTLESSSGYFQNAKYKVKLTKEGYIPREQNVESSVNGWYFGNIVFGGLLGILIVDPATGAMWKIYDDNVNIKMYPDSKDGKLSMIKETFKGEELFKNGEYDQVIASATEAISYYPEYVNAYCIRSAAYTKKSDFDRALTDAEKAIELQPDNSRNYLARADVHVAKGDYNKALTDIDKAITLKPDYGDALFERGKIKVKLNNSIEAKNDMKSACDNGNSSACNYQF